MWETSNSPARRRVCKCSSTIPVEYWMGISQPAKSTIRAPRATWRLYRAVRFILTPSSSDVWCAGSAEPGRQASQPLRPRLHKAPDPVEDVLRGEMGLFEDLLQRAPRAPAVVPVRRHRVLLTDPRIQPIVHQPSRLGGDHGRVQALLLGEHLHPV